MHTLPTDQHCHSRARWWELCSEACSHQVQVLSGCSAELCCPSHPQACQVWTFILLPLVHILELGEGLHEWQDISWCACEERHANASEHVRNRCRYSLPLAMKWHSFVLITSPIFSHSTCTLEGPAPNNQLWPSALTAPSLKVCPVSSMHLHIPLQCIFAHIQRPQALYHQLRC